MSVTRSGRAARGFVLLASLCLAGCPIFPAPTPPTPLTKAEVAGVAKCQKAVEKAQLAFIKAQLAALGSCVNGVLNVRLPFESGLTTLEDFEAGLAKMRPKCTKSYAKVTAASTKLVDAILKACTPVETFVLGPYDGLRFLSGQDVSGDPPATLVALAGTLCTATVEIADMQLWYAAPRLMELLGHLGPAYVLPLGAETGLPNTPLDPRCAPLQDMPEM